MADASENVPPPAKGLWRRILTAELPSVAWFFKDIASVGLKAAYRRLRAYRTISASDIFDAEFYRVQMPRAALSDTRLLRHYVTVGYREALDPSPAFSTTKYLDFYPDVKALEADPLSHFLMYGRGEHRITLPSSAYSGPVRSLNATQAEEHDRHRWMMQERPQSNISALGLYDIRPDDAVPVEGLRGDVFLARYRLLSEQPDFAGAVAELVALADKPAGAADAADTPDISVIIPVYGQLAYTLNCLHSLLSHTAKASFEIIVGDDASPDESALWLGQLKGVRYMRHSVNSGFIANCNLTAASARGRLLVLLNNDTRVAEGWLDALAASFQAFPKAGLVGSKVFYPDGRLQEAGGILWQDGSAWNYGRDDDPNRPRYCYARQVDYVSGCAIAVPTAIWREMNGFDDHFAPAYYEDVDLCFRLRQAGYETWFQPTSRVIHYEGKTSGTDTGQGVKAYQVSNAGKFHERWKTELASHRPNGEAPWLERDRGVDKRVLIVDSANPTPWRDAGSVAIVNLFRYYRALGYQPSFAPENFLYEARAVSEMQAVGVQCFYAPYEPFLAAILQRYGDLFDVVHVIRVDVAYKSIELIRSLTPQAAAIYQNCDLHYLRMERQAAVENSSALLTAAAEMKVRELQVSRDFDLTVTHSQAEKSLLDDALPDEHIVVMPLIEALVASTATFDSRKDFMFLGGYGHPPNVDAVHWLLGEIWPVIAEQCPQARLLLVGANPPPDILAAASDRIVVTGLVEDLAPWFDRTRVFLAALRYGAGSKGKVLSSMAHGVPVVATRIAAEGFPLENGKSVFLADTSEDIVQQALDLYGLDEVEWQVQSDAARDYIRRHHSFDANVRQLERALAYTAQPENRKR